MPGTSGSTRHIAKVKVYRECILTFSYEQAGKIPTPNGGRQPKDISATSSAPALHRMEVISAPQTSGKSR
jgi:hypothetical protein